MSGFPEFINKHTVTKEDSEYWKDYCEFNLNLPKVYNNATARSLKKYTGVRDTAEFNEYTTAVTYFNLCYSAEAFANCALVREKKACKREYQIDKDLAHLSSLHGDARLAFAAQLKAKWDEKNAKFELWADEHLRSK